MNVRERKYRARLESPVGDDPAARQQFRAERIRAWHARGATPTAGNARWWQPEGATNLGWGYPSVHRSTQTDESPVAATTWAPSDLLRLLVLTGFFAWCVDRVCDRILR